MLRMYNQGPIKTPTTARPLPHGNNQQSPAVQSLIGTVYGGFGTAPRSNGSLGRRKSANRGSKTAARRSVKKGVSYRKSAAASKGKARTKARLVKGSAAAKRYMASIRKLRK